MGVFKIYALNKYLFDILDFRTRRLSQEQVNETAGTEAAFPSVWLTLTLSKCPIGKRGRKRSLLTVKGTCAHALGQAPMCSPQNACGRCLRASGLQSAFTSSIATLHGQNHFTFSMQFLSN